jgi:hypothetical protein
MWSSTSSAPVEHASGTLSTSDVKVGKKNRNFKFPCILCEVHHYSYLFPRMDEDFYLLENIQLPTSYHNISPKTSLVDRLVNLAPSLVSLVDRVVNLVSSLVEPLTQVFDPVPSSINPTIHLKSETQVIDLVSSSIIPTLHLKSAKLIDLVLSSINPTPPLKSAIKVVDLVLSSVDPTPHSKSQDFVQVYFVNIDSPGQGGTPPVPIAPPSSNQMIFINWNHLKEPCLPSYVPFQITVKVCDRNIPKTIIDEGSSVNILFMNAWKAFGSVQLAPMTQNLLTFDRRVSQPLGILPLF